MPNCINHDAGLKGEVIIPVIKTAKWRIPSISFLALIFTVKQEDSVFPNHISIFVYCKEKGLATLKLVVTGEFFFSEKNLFSFFFFVIACICAKSANMFCKGNSALEM